MSKLMYGECIHHNNLATCQLCKNPDQNYSLPMRENKTKGFVKDYTGKIKKACPPPPPMKKHNPIVEDINLTDGKLTAVEFLANTLFNLYDTTFMSSQSKSLLALRIRQAIELEKKQHNKTYLDGAFEMELKTGKSFSDYYNEIYGNKEGN